MPFREVWDAITKSKMLVKIWEDAGLMHKESKKMFKLSFNCLVNCDDKVACNLSEEDIRINKYEVKIRNEILEYLAINRSPNLNASLILSSIVIDYERIGDYCKNIAQLTLLFPTKLTEDRYMKLINEMKEAIIKSFDLTYKAFQKDDKNKAKNMIKGHENLKNLHSDLVKKINENKKLDVHKAIVYASLATYLRRISAHLKNICSGVINPFPELGFKKGRYGKYIDL
jgi:phosphate uptake regulator